jgi:hypothetical protein
MRNLLIILLLLIIVPGKAQEVLNPLGYNPAYKNAPAPPVVKSTAKGGNTAVKLPFIDDFSRPGIFPYTDHWEDERYVFINRTYAVNPPSLGVATFDAMNDTGGVYSHVTTFPTPCDTLTSLDIRLDSSFTLNKALSPADSVYLSFYIQPQGIGDDPQRDDSIVLQFYAPDTGVWHTVWHHEGMPLDSFKTKYGSDFLQVLIPITDTVYFKPNFKFRFFNYASIPGNNIPSWRSGVYDHWNLDYVYLNAGRDYQDTYRQDLAITGNVSSLLTNYTAMPWNQFKANTAAEMNHAIEIRYDKLTKPTQNRNVAQYFSIQNLDDKTFFYPTPNPASVNMTTDFRTFKPNYSSYTYNSNASPYADFQVVFTMSTTPDINRNNDSLKFYQRFYNYYAYDDGVPEAGYGLSAPNARLAIQFKANTADSIQAVQFYFNQTLGLASQQYFTLCIWNDNGGKPGSLIYQQKNVRPEYGGRLFEFVTYVLDHAVSVSGTFYVGWTQSTGDNLNVGWDYNNIHNDRVFYNTTGNWYNSSYKGITMIRPIMGTEDEAYVGIGPVEKAGAFNIIIAPNPVQNGRLNLICAATDEAQPAQSSLRIFNLNGQMVVNRPFQQQLDVSQLPAGIYFLQIIGRDGQIRTSKKFIINKP